MKLVLQRVSRASVQVEGHRIGHIDRGLLLLTCIEKGDRESQIRHWARRIPRLRVFQDSHGKMNRSLKDIEGSILVVSQFTLVADLSRKGLRPSFSGAETPERASYLLECFCKDLTAEGIPVETGRFGAMMAVELVNDGPVTFIIDDPPET